MPWALAIFSREPTTPVSLAPLQFQVFLKQINSSLVDSNMLVRCVTLSLDRFENQVDMKGKRRLSAEVSPSIVVALVSNTQPLARRQKFESLHNQHGWGQGSGSLGDFHEFSLSSMLPLMGMYDILIKENQNIVASKMQETTPYPSSPGLELPG